MENHENSRGFIIPYEAGVAAGLPPGKKDSAIKIVKVQRFLFVGSMKNRRRSERRHHIAAYLDMPSAALANASSSACASCAGHEVGLLLH